MIASALRTTDGTPVVIGQRLGRGGEGTVHLVVNASNVAVKLYHDNGDDREHRLQALIHAGRSSKASAVAWPKQRVVDISGATAGFLMAAYSDARPIHELYTPMSRRTFFPAASRGFLVRTALNLARVVAKLHRDGFVIGDLNHSSVLVLPNATVRIVDVDSFPLPPDYICRVGTPEYMPAELQGADLGSVRRYARHDVFALSVLIYQLLVSGRHPFAGHGGRPSGDLGENIRRSKRYQLTERQQVDLSAALTSRQSSMAMQLFQNVFTRSGKHEESASDWVATLMSS